MQVDNIGFGAVEAAGVGCRVAVAVAAVGSIAAVAVVDGEP